MLPRRYNRAPERPARLRASTTFAANGRSLSAISSGSIRAVSASAAAGAGRWPRAVNSARPIPPSATVPAFLARVDGVAFGEAELLRLADGAARFRGAGVTGGGARRRLT